jgi:YHS domain-containing protein
MSLSYVIRRKFLAVSTLALFIGSMSAPVHASDVIKPIFSTAAGAIRGYDPVAYFKLNKPVRGSAKFKTEWQGAIWHFSSQDNLDAFVASPEKYAPQYGGYCAYGVAQGYTPETDPAAFQVRDNKLYLNLSKAVLKKWQMDIPGYVKDANENWPALKAGTYVEK